MQTNNDSAQSVEVVTPSRKKNSGLFYSIVAIDIVLAAILFSSIQSDGDDSVASSPTPIVAPTTSASLESVAPSVSPVASLKANFTYTSSGIELTWQSDQSAMIESVVVSSTENGGASKDLITLSSGESSANFEKVDTAGVTNFKVAATLQDGSVVESTLEIRGLFVA